MVLLQLILTSPRSQCSTSTTFLHFHKFHFCLLNEFRTTKQIKATHSHTFSSISCFQQRFFFGAQNQELDMLRLQVMDKQAKLDAAEKTKHQYKDTIKEQMAHISILQNEVSTLRAAIVEEASVAVKSRHADRSMTASRHIVWTSSSFNLSSFFLFLLL